MTNNKYQPGDIVDLDDVVWRSPEVAANVLASIMEGVQLFLRAGLEFDPAQLELQACRLKDDVLHVFVELPHGHEVSALVSSNEWGWRK